MTDKLINKCKYVYNFTENWATRILYWDIIICRISGEKWRCDCVTCHVVTLWILRGSVNFIWDSWRHVNHKWWCHLLMLLFFIIYFYIKQEKSRVRQIRYIRFTNDPLRVHRGSIQSIMNSALSVINYDFTNPIWICRGQ